MRCCNIEDDNSELLHQTQAPGNSDMNRFHPQNKPKMWEKIGRRILNQYWLNGYMNPIETIKKLLLSGSCLKGSLLNKRLTFRSHEAKTLGGGLNA